MCLKIIFHEIGMNKLLLLLLLFLLLLSLLLLLLLLLLLSLLLLLFSLSSDHPFQVYYKVRQAVITKCDRYYDKVRLNKQPNEWLPPTTLLSNCVQPRQFFFSSI